MDGSTDNSVRRASERCFDQNFLWGGETFDLVKAAPADNADRGWLVIHGQSIRFRESGRSAMPLAAFARYHQSLRCRLKLSRRFRPCLLSRSPEFEIGRASCRERV